MPTITLPAPIREAAEAGQTTTLSPASLQIVTTDWTQASTTAPVSFTSDWDLSIDHTTYR